MKAVERLKESPLRYAVPWSMTLLRPLIGAYGVHDSRQGKWGKAEVDIAIAWATDFEGLFARGLKATSIAGAIADPIADGILRAESLVALAPEMPVTASLVGTIEIYNLKLNATVQKGREKPYVPMAAKIGTVIEGAGVVWAAEGVRKESALQRAEGKVAMLAGAGLRLFAYKREAQRLHNSIS